MPHALRRTVHPVAFGAAAVREARRRMEVRSTIGDLKTASRRGAPVVVGPFVGEVGFELLYWLPFVRHLMHRHGVAPEQVTVVSRGGAGTWYRDLATGAIDAIDLIGEEAYTAGLRQRRSQAGDAKQVHVAPFDVELLARAAERMAERPCAVLHPSAMVTCLRHIWSGRRPVAALARSLEPMPLERPAGSAVPEQRPYVAVKAYTSDVLPDSPATRASLEDLTRRLGERLDVVVLALDHPLDDHDDWSPAVGNGTMRRRPVLRAVDNLAEQTRIVAAAAGLLTTYGGFSYLGALLSVPTIGLVERAVANPVHLAALAWTRERTGLRAPFETVELTSVAGKLGTWPSEQR